MQRSSSSHKGDNGKIAVIGGSRFIHGAPLMCALAAEASGVDTMSIYLPSCHEEVAKSTTLNVFVHPFAEDDLSEEDVEPILELLATLDCAVIGPGISRAEESKNAMRNIIASVSCPLVLDATALQPDIVKLVSGKTVVLTPHRGELEQMGLTENDAPAIAKDAGITICLKGEVDQIFGPNGNKDEVEGGNAGLTVGGTGDALAGLIVGLIAQKMDPFDAAVTASTIIKNAGAALFQNKEYAYSTQDVIEQIPILLRT